MDTISPELLLILFGTGLVAGLVDSIAGGGGLITVPVLLWTGLSPVEVLATNKLQGTAGTFTASLRFLHNGNIRIRTAWRAVVFTLLGAGAGTVLVQHLDARLLMHLIPVLLIAFAVYFLFSPRVSDVDARRRIGEGPFAVLIGTSVGLYDGFFGPGTGTFFAIAFVGLLGYNLRRATAHTKLLNFTSNITSLAFFIPGGHVVWTLGLVMAGGQFVGAWTGTHLVLRHGTRLIRPVLVVVSLAISIKLLIGGR